MLQMCSRSVCSVIVLEELFVSVDYRFISTLPKKEQLQLDLSTPVGLPMLETPSRNRNGQLHSEGIPFGTIQAGQTSYKYASYKYTLT